MNIERVNPDLNHEYNTSNHPKDPNDMDIQDKKYDIELDKTRLCNYMSLIGYPTSWTYTLTEDEASILLECATVGKKVGSARLFKDELEPIINRLNKDWQSGLWFFRFDSNSPKDGNPVFPIMSASDAINKIVTSKRAWTSLLREDRKIYFVSYDRSWDQRREFRVFIYKRRITAISQYYSYDRGMLSNASDDDIIKIINMIVDHVNKYINPVCDSINTDNIVCDVYVNTDEKTIKIIEFNSFGYWLASGSCLFHWIKDKNILYGTGDTIHVRVVKYLW